MARTPSTMLALGTTAPNFRLPDPAQKFFALEDFRGKKGLLVAFICNHCPYVKHIRSAFAAAAKDFQSNDIAVVAISSNDIENYPDDSPQKMAEEIKAAGYTFPYLYDEDQSVAKAYQAACTPDFFLFDSALKLVYRGQFDDSRPKNDAPVTGQDLKNAATALLANKPISETQNPSIGCNIKWKAGNEPDYYR